MSETLHASFSYTKMLIAELDAEDRSLVDEAKKTTANAYSKYSKYNVGASILLSNGTVVSSSNQENAAYPNGHCAESIAFSYANSQYKSEHVVAVAIAATKHESGKFHPVSPCGKCRQVMLEFELKQKVPFKVMLVMNNDEIILLDSVSNLLPLCFSEDMLAG